MHLFHFASLRGTTICRFPKPNQTWFGSHREAAAELVTHLELYHEYLLHMRDKKKNPSWTNIQLNLYQALGDSPTITELCSMTLYHEAVSVPYMQVVQGQETEDNLLKLGYFHRITVLGFVEGIIAKPETLVLSDASFEDGSMDGQAWEHPEAILAVQ